MRQPCCQRACNATARAGGVVSGLGWWRVRDGAWDIPWGPAGAGWRGRGAGFRGVRACLLAVLACRDGAGAGLLGWAGSGGGGALPVVQELAEVADGAGQLEFGAGGVAAAVAEVAAEPGEELGEERLYLGGAAFVQALAGRGGEPGGHVLPAWRQRGAARQPPGLGGLAVDGDQQQQVLQGLEVRGGGVAVTGEPGADLPAQPGLVAVGGGGGDHGDQGAGVGGVVVQLDGGQHLA